MNEDSASCIFNKAIEMEYDAQQLYLRFAGLFQHFNEIAVFWKDLANDEAIHAEKLCSIRDNMSRDKLTSPVSSILYHNSIKSHAIDIGHIMSTINDLDDAYEIAHDIEFSEVNVIFKLLVTDYGAADQRRDFLASEIKNHQSKLVNFGQRFGDKIFRSSIEAVNSARSSNIRPDKMKGLTMSAKASA